MVSENSGKSRWKRRVIVCLLLGIPTVWLGRWLLPPPALVVSKETTFITEPLTADGKPDYLAAINREYSRGVTPENNALIPLLEALGPAILPDATRDQYYRLLGVPLPPQDVKTLDPYDDYMKAHAPPRDPDSDTQPEPESLDILPFTAEQRPLTAAWIEANRVPAEKILEAAARTQFFAPVAMPADKASLYSLLLPEIQGSRNAGRLLSLRSMLRLTSGDTAGALEDCIACLRLGRLIGQHCCLIGNLVGIANYHLGVKAGEQLLLSEKLTIEQLQKLRTEIDRLPPLPDIARTVNWGERAFVLQAFTERLNIAEISLGDFNIPKFVTDQMDINHAMPVVNETFNEAVQAMSEPDPVLRREKLKAFSTALDQRLGSVRFRSELGKMLLRTRASASRIYGEVICRLFCPALPQAQTAVDRALARHLLLRTSVALAEHRLKHGSYPDSLQALTPDFLPSLPTDPFSGQPLHYQRHGSSYLLYSVGDNGIDEQGRQDKDDMHATPRPDDLRFGTLPTGGEQPAASGQ